MFSVVSRLCNACGISFSSTGKLPTRTGSTNRAKSIILTRMLKSRTPNTIAKRIPRLTTTKSQLPLHISADPITSSPVPTQGDATPLSLADVQLKPAWQRKVFLKAGLYSTLYKKTYPTLRSLAKSKNGLTTTSRVTHNRATRNAAKVGRFMFPLPINFGEHLINTERDFFLTYDILEGAELGGGGKRWQDGFVKIRNSEFLSFCIM